jgi:hypothetical protein
MLTGVYFKMLGSCMRVSHAKACSHLHELLQAPMCGVATWCVVLRKKLVAYALVVM